MRTGFFGLWACLACLGAGCAPRPELTHPAAVAAQRFLDACGSENSQSWRTLLIAGERADLPWSPSWAAGASCTLAELSGNEALVRVTLADAPTPTHPLVLHFEEGMWRVSLRESLVAWAVDPRNDTRLLAHR